MTKTRQLNRYEFHYYHDTGRSLKLMVIYLKVLNIRCALTKQNQQNNNNKKKQKQKPSKQVYTEDK